MARKINAALGGILVCILSGAVLTGCSNSKMSDDDVKNFKPSNIDMSKRSKDIASGMDNYYKMHPEQKRPDASATAVVPK